MARVHIAPEATGAVARVIGLRFDVEGLQLPVGSGVRVRSDGRELVGQVVGVDGDRVSCMPFGDLRGVRVGARVHIDHDSITVPVGYSLLGRVLNGMGVPIDDGPPLGVVERVVTEGQPPHPLRRTRIDTPLSTGVRAWDTLATLGRGQRVGVFAGSGVGKSTLLGMVARNTSADINVVAMIGERGREVREFIESDLGPEGLARSVVIVATSDEPALVRLRAAATATRIAEWFRDRDRHVLLMMDSLTRFCMAQREIGLSAGEPPTTRAYPPSVFALLPGLLERAGTAERRFDHGHLHGARRRRRHERADLRRRPLDPRRPHRALAPARSRQPLPRHRRALLRVTCGAGRHHSGATRRRRASSAHCWPPTPRLAI